MNTRRRNSKKPDDIEGGETLIDAKKNGDVDHEVDITIERPSGCCRSNACRYVLYGIDLFLAFTVFTVINVAFWRGAWGILDIYVFPGEVDYEGDYDIFGFHGSAITYAVGASSRVLRVALEPTFRKLHNALRYGWAQYIAKIIFNFVDGCFMIAQWRGLYNVFDYIVGYDFVPNVIGLSVATVILVGSRSFSSTLGLPMCIIRDSRKDFYVCWPRYRTERRRPCAFVLDHLYSVLVCETGAILAWQAFWNIWENFIDYEQGHQALLRTTGLGLIILLFLCALQVPVASLSTWLARRWHWIYSLVLEDTYFFLILMGQMGYWVGLWEILIEYVLPDNELYSCLVVMFGSYVLMAIFGITSGLANSGISVDLESKNGQGAMWEPHFFLALLNATERNASAIIPESSEYQSDDNYNTPYGVDNPAVEPDTGADSGVYSVSVKF